MKLLNIIKKLIAPQKPGVIWELATPYVNY